MRVKAILLLFAMLLSGTIAAQEDMKQKVEMFIQKTSKGNAVKEKKIRDDLKKIDDAYERSRKEEAQKAELKARQQAEAGTRTEAAPGQRRQGNNPGVGKAHNGVKWNHTAQPANDSRAMKARERDMKRTDEAVKSADKNFEGVRKAHDKTMDEIERNANYQLDGRADFILEHRMGKQPKGNRISESAGKPRSATSSQRDVKEGLVKPMMSEAELWKRYCKEGRKLSPEEERRVKKWLERTASSEDEFN